MISGATGMCVISHLKAIPARGFPSHKASVGSPGKKKSKEDYITENGLYQINVLHLDVLFSKDQVKPLYRGLKVILVKLKYSTARTVPLALWHCYFAGNG